MKRLNIRPGLAPQPLIRLSMERVIGRIIREGAATVYLRPGGTVTTRRTTRKVGHYTTGITLAELLDDWSHACGQMRRAA